MFVMPAQRVGVSAPPRIRRGKDGIPVQLVIVPPVFELLLDASAHFETLIRRDGHIARIKQAMDVTPKQESVSGLMFAAIAVGANMRGFERGQSSLVCDCATSILDISYEHPERSLAESRLDELRLTEPCPCFGHPGDVRPV